MSTFLTKDDYLTRIDADILDRILDTAEDEAAAEDLLDKAEEQAIAFITSFLSSRYDTDAVFEAAGDERNPILVMYTADIALFYLYLRVAPEAIPEPRIAAYEIAEKWLAKVQAEKVNPAGLPKPDDGSKDYVRFGGNRPRRNHLS